MLSSFWAWGECLFQDVISCTLDRRLDTYVNHHYIVGTRRRFNLGTFQVACRQHSSKSPCHVRQRSKWLKELESTCILFSSLQMLRFTLNALPSYTVSYLIILKSAQTLFLLHKIMRGREVWEKGSGGYHGSPPETNISVLHQVCFPFHVAHIFSCIFPIKLPSFH